MEREDPWADLGGGVPDRREPSRPSATTAKTPRKGSVLPAEVVKSGREGVAAARAALSAVRIRG
jgi:hypothetical protein